MRCCLTASSGGADEAWLSALLRCYLLPTARIDACLIRTSGLNGDAFADAVHRRR
ncbi:hypothetical protein PAMC26510_16195 [Caballeronia sordidicola]|uniref:Uncharacterized protein n=1 Tax=Caballeronia sordidicola TaxID=196367 RepID=A0A242MTS9_CABSO|nr:hypothetical protein PAMC26510_16195 [Caballeronia sordidicola]